MEAGKPNFWSACSVNEVSRCQLHGFTREVTRSIAYSENRKEKNTQNSYISFHISGSHWPHPRGGTAHSAETDLESVTLLTTPRQAGSCYKHIFQPAGSLPELSFTCGLWGLAKRGVAGLPGLVKIHFYGNTATLTCVLFTPACTLPRPG